MLLVLGEWVNGVAMSRSPVRQRSDLVAWMALTLIGMVG